MQYITGEIKTNPTQSKNNTTKQQTENIQLFITRVQNITFKNRIIYNQRLASIVKRVQK